MCPFFLVFQVFIFHVRSSFISEDTIYLIRHGEKVSGEGCLSKQGEERAAHLVNIFDGSKFSTPNALFAFDYDKKGDCERCLQTVCFRKVTVKSINDRARTLMHIIITCHTK